MGEITEFAQKVKQLEREEKDYQEALSDPPDEFLDPIMSTLMTGKCSHCSYIFDLLKLENSREAMKCHKQQRAA